MNLDICTGDGGALLKCISPEGNPFLQGIGSFISSSVLRILKRGGPGNSKNLRRTKLRMNIVSLEFCLIFRPKLGEDKKKKYYPGDPKRGGHGPWPPLNTPQFISNCCARTGIPSVYTRGLSFVDWI